ncbi:substrate-binding periplasmic protein [Kiloniella antarctica]|uniref:Substrate-binding periplasmic protein n=1 Tax=Kiloniella antarctica TaxID=1550907 RepID=A0ABW5BJ62_9PROT
MYPTTLSKWLQALVFTCFVFIPTSGIAKEITIGMGNFEPYYIAKGDTGIFTDLIVAVFHRLPDHEPRFIFGRPNNRLWRDFNNGKVDAVSNLFDSVETKSCRSDPIFRFRDVAVTRTKSDVNLESIRDLRGKRTIAFQGAKEFFGPEFSSAVSEGSYSEASEPRLQVQALMDNRVDVSIGDMFILLHSIRSKSEKGNLENEMRATEFRIHDILPVVFSRMGFWDLDLCRDFNLALKQVKDSGEYEKIYANYLKSLGLSLVPTQ